MSHSTGTQRCRVGDCTTEKQLLVLAFTEAHTTRHILEQFFGVRSDGTIRFDNNYFKASVTLQTVYEPDHDLLLSDEDWKRDLSQFPAVVLLASDQQAEPVSKCKVLWDSLRTLFSADAIRILFLEGQDMNEKDTYKLVEWGIARQIEVVNMFLCGEDDIDLSLRLKRILECAPWSSSSHTTTQDAELARESQPKPVVQVDIGEHSMADDSLSKPTRLRRGLQNSDVTRLVDDLLLVDDADSDT